jgi:DNA primase
MSLSPQFLDELRSRTLLSGLIGKTLKLQRAGREWKACCPFHNEKSPSFYVNDDKGFYHCFGCSAHGDAIRWLTEQQGLPFIDAVKEIAANAGMDMPAPDPQAAERAERQSSLHDVMAAAQAWFTEQLAGIDGAEARAYLKRRHVSPELAAEFGLGFAPDSRGKLKTALSSFGDAMLVEAGLLIAVDDKDPYDRFRGRLMIPIRDPRGRCIAFGGRILGAGEPKYLNSPDTPLFDKGRTLWNLDRAAPASRKSGRLIAVEGYMDAIALAGVGINEVVAPLGTALTEAQIERMWRLVDEPVLCFDGDSAGQKAAVRAAIKALPGVLPNKSLEFVTLPAGQDPDDVIRRGGANVLQKLLAMPEPLVAFVWRNEVEANALETPEQRAGLRTRLEALARSVNDPFVASEYSKAFKDRFFDRFGFKAGQRGFSKTQIQGIRSSIAASRPQHRVSVNETIIRAILLGVSRYTDVLFSEIEGLLMIRIENPYLDRWRTYLVEAAYHHPELDEDAIDTILSDKDVAPIEKRDIRRDLAFSFFRKDDARAQSDLREVINVTVSEQQIRETLAQAESRFMATINEYDWVYNQASVLEAHALAQKQQDIAASLREAA